MNVGVATWLQRRWYGPLVAGPGLRLLAGLYGGAVRIRRAAYRHAWLRAQRIGVPVIVIGNLGVGGSGKTPLVIALVESLRLAGWNPGVVSRGYGRRSRGPCRVDADTRPSDGGDEPVQIARRTGVAVMVDADRVAAARALCAQGCNVIVADDGLQHYRLRRDIEIEVIDGARGYGNARLLPAGPLREPVERAQDCDFQVVNGGDPVATAANRYAMQLRGSELVGLGGAQRKPLVSLAGHRVHAVAGIGDPPRFFGMLRQAGIDPIEHAFADHRVYRAHDFAFAESLPIVMTEKDAVKCAGLGLQDAWMLPVHAQLADAFFAALFAQLTLIAGTRMDTAT